MRKHQTYQGIGLEAGDLIVYFTVGHEGARRFLSVRVPINELVLDEVMYEIHKAAAKKLRDYWEGAVVQDSLFGLQSTDNQD